MGTISLYLSEAEEKDLRKLMNTESAKDAVKKLISQELEKITEQ